MLAALQPTAQGQRPAVPQQADDKTVVHVLNRLGFGPTRASLERVRRIGLFAYIEEQLHPDRIADTAVAALGIMKIALGWPLQLAALGGMVWLLARNHTPMEPAPGQ